MKLTKVIMTLTLITFGFSACKPKDSDIQTNVVKAIGSCGMEVSVLKGVVTLSGECASESCKTSCEKKIMAVKGVKSIVDNCTIPAPKPEPIPVPVPVSVTTVLDAATQQMVKDGLTNIPGVEVVFSEDKAILTGAISKPNRMKLMQILASAKVKSDVSKLTNK